MSYKHLTADKRMELFQASSTKTVQELAVIYGVHRATVCNIIRKQGQPRKKHVVPNAISKIADAERERLHAQLRETSLNDRELSDKYGVSRERIRQIRKKLGLPPSRSAESAVYKDKKERVQARKRAIREKAAANLAEKEQIQADKRAYAEKRWAEGALSPVIAGEMGMTKGVFQQYLNRCRKKNPDSFPLRRPCYYRGKGR